MRALSELNSTGKKVLVIGLDGATWMLLRPWIKEGRLPTLQKLVNEGASGDLTSTVPPLTAAAWVSLATGKNPGKHGILDFVFPVKDSYDVSIANGGRGGSKAVWNIAGDYDQRVAIVGVPMTYPPEQVNGIMISSFMTPGPESEYTYPTPLKQELLAKGYTFPTSLNERNRSKDVDNLLREVAADTEERVRTVLYLLEHKPWDLFCFVFLSPDLLQHDLWRILDPTHPQHRKSEEKYLNDIANFYSRLDTHISNIISRADDDTLVILLSDHGFGRATHFLYVNNWLLAEGLLRRRNSLLSLAKYSMFRLGITPMNGFKLLSLLGLGWLRQVFRFGRNYGRVRHLMFSFDDIDWSNTRAYSVGNFGQIYLNVRGKRPSGIVEPGTEYEKLRDEISQKLLDLRDPTTGQRIIESVAEKEELFWGEYLDYAPDLVPFSRNLEYVSFGTSDFGSNKAVMPIFGLSGYHRMEGILVMYGGDIKPGILLDHARILDIAPTILYAMGIPVPSDMDGKVLLEAFRPDFASTHPVVTADATMMNDQSVSTYTQDEEEEVRKRLKGIGYGA